MTGLLVLALYVAAFFGSFLLAKKIFASAFEKKGFNRLKTVTFGDESAITANRVASIVSVITVFWLWVAFTNSVIPLPKFPGPYSGDMTFTYTAQLEDGSTDDATVTMRVYREDIQQTVDAEGNPGREPSAAEVEPGDGFAKNDTLTVARYGFKVVNVWGNDEVSKKEGSKIVALNGEPIAPGEKVSVPEGTIGLTDKGTPTFAPATGLRMARLYLPAPELVFARFIELNVEGYQGYKLWEHTGYSLFRVLVGFLLGALVGVPIGYAMGLTGWARGWFDPIVEFMRPIPPLALIPLIIIWFGIGENGKIVLLFLASLWIMIIAARSGVSGVAIAKVHAAYSLGASKSQILTKVIVPNSLPDIFTGARVAMGVCWGTVVAAELVAANVGLGKMIVTASKFQLTDIIIVGIVVIGLIGFAIEVGMRKLESWLIPWRGKV
ncbi:Putative aliphatic sulfonates transport permease protein SsuC [Ascidiaceihabitans donghaensis]|uniref:Aliphatic sulfonates transport permease protein SsuC n=1 Tax=Ascidiaceihabitans donghaensis TaxID=1510460 RepID=A0A2R8BIG3_9RHOB|nr:ABC transporter permease [Ascidiaceihabitans donghaensis]SPH22778.1 Putative aliphatic sulfonates transport permease protein SsuC [Ascidiaceihabitans donghaensis]